MIMVRWSTRLLSIDNRYQFIHSIKPGQFISPVTNGQKIFLDNKNFITNIEVSKKIRRYMFYRLKTKTSHIDAHISTIFMIRKDDGKICFRRLAEIRDNFELVLYDKDNNYLLFEKPLSLIRDTSRTRFFGISKYTSNLIKPSVITNGFVILL